MTPKQNYGLMLDKKLEALKAEGNKPLLLLHSCCAPCSSHCLQLLDEYFRIVLYFCNPNIAPESEYEYRCSELKRFVSEAGIDAEIITEKYDPAPFYSLAKGLEDAPERGERCRRCIALRLKMAGEKAALLHADYFTTTLTISPHKDCAFINECGAEISGICGVEYLFSDFKKHDGYKHSIELSRKYNLYRQNYCGCVYSKRQAEKRKSCSNT